MTGSAPRESISGHLREGKIIYRATRWASNPNWSYRGDNTKYRSKK